MVGATGKRSRVLRVAITHLHGEVAVAACAHPSTGPDRLVVFPDDLGCAATEAAFVPRAPTLLIEQGVAIKAVQATPGHSTIATTMDVYSHVTPAMQDSVAEATDRLFGTAGN